MFNQEEIRKVHASQIDSFLRLSQISFGGIERIVRLQLDMSRQSLDDQGKLVGELVKLSNPQDVANHVSKAASASRVTASTSRHRASGSCSTQPGAGKNCSSSRLARATTRLCRSNTMARELVVP